MRNNKAQSDVVSTVLIILLVVAAVAIIGAIILNVVNKGGSSVSGATACQAVDIHPTACNLGASQTTAIAQRGSGGSTDATVSSITFIFTKSDGTTVTNVSAPIANIGTVGGTSSVVQVNGGFTQVETAATLTLSDGSSKTCDPSTVQVSCN